MTTDGVKDGEVAELIARGARFTNDGDHICAKCSCDMTPATPGTVLCWGCAHEALEAALREAAGVREQLERWTCPACTESRRKASR